MSENVQASVIGERARRSWVTRVIIAIGAVALVAAIGAGVLTGIQLLNRGGLDKSLSVAGVSAVSVHVAAGDFELVYADVSEARLVVEGDSGWTLENHDGTLEVRAPWRLFGGWFGLGDKVVLTLPNAVRDSGWDGEFHVSAGDARFAGDFGELKLRVSAGALTMQGSAEGVDASVSAGSMRVDVADARTARLSVSAGRIDGALTGVIPDLVDVNVSAGNVDLTVPDAVYAVSSDVSAGGFDHDLDTASSSPHRIEVDVSAGGVRIQAAK